MYAIVKTGGKQYTVKPGDVFDVEKLPGEVGDKVALPVLFLNDEGTIVTDADELAKVVVEAEILKQHKGEKKIIFKFKKRKGYKRTKGHRQNLTLIGITNVNGVEVPTPQPPSKRAEKAQPAQEAADASEAAAGAEGTDAADENLSKMTVAQLKDLAKERDVKLPSGARKADIIEALQSA